MRESVAEEMNEWEPFGLVPLKNMTSDYVNAKCFWFDNRVELII